MEYLSACPLCSGSSFAPYLTCKDYTVSHETFQLQKCSHCNFVITSPRPGNNDLPKYYESDAYISHSDKSQSIVDTIYKISRTFTLRWKYNLVQKNTLQKPVSILDYGCGTGAFLLECMKHHMNISGVEPSKTALTQAQAKTSGQIVPDVRDIKDTFDVVTLWHVLEHVSHLHQTVENLKARLKENGTMFIAVPNLQSHDAKKYGAYWAGYDVPRHLWHFSRSTMQRLLTHHNLKLINVAPMRLDAFYVSLLSEKYKNGNTTIPGMAKAFFRGMKSNMTAANTGEYSSLIYIARK